MKRAHDLQELVDAGLAPSVTYLQKRLRAGLIRGMKAGRHWVMTDEHIEAYIATQENNAIPRIPRHDAPTGLSAASMRRRAS